MIGEKRKRDSSKSEPVDSGLVDELGDRLTLIAGDEKKNISNSSNVDNLATFANKYSGQILQAWSYYSQTNNHSKLISATGKLGWFLATCGRNLQTLQKQGAIVIREIIEHHLKIIYRCLFSNRPTMTNPALRILTEIVKFNSGSNTGDLFSSLDLSLKAFPKILASSSEDSSTTPNHASMRTAFLLFYLAFIKNSSAIIRKDLILQKKIVAGWFKRLNQDPDDLIVATLTTFTDQIFLESAFTKSTKISFFNDWVLGNLVKLFARSEQVVDEVSKFLTILATDSTNGIRFPDNGWYPPSIKAPTSKAENSTAPLSSNEESVNNRLLLSLLKTLKPWEDIAQQDLSIAILSASPELVAPYITVGLDSMSFNPRLSSFWISYANFLSRIIQLPIPHLQSLQPPPALVVVESILPSVVCKSSSLTKCLSFEVPLVRYLTCQIIIFSLRKTLLVSKEYSKRGWDTSDFTYVISDRLPNLPIIVSALNSRPEPESEGSSLVGTVITIALSLYGAVFPESISNFSLPASLTNNWQQSFEASEVDGLKLVQVRESLELQMSSSAIGKWWNKSPGSNYSIFTRLIQLGISNGSFSDQVCKLLHGLTNPTLLFQDETLVSPIEVLIQSLRSSVGEMSQEDKDKVWMLIDESVARCMRSPYKYVDEFASSRNTELDVMSPIIVTMLEQWKFVKSSANLIEKWLCRFIRDCCICGESWKASFKLATGKAGLSEFTLLLQESEFAKWGDIVVPDEFFDFVLSSDPKLIIARTDLKFKVLGPYELQAIKFRLVRESENKKLVSHLFASIPEFLISYFSQESFFKDLLVLPQGEVAAAYFSTLRSFTFHDPEISLSEIKSYVARNISNISMDKLEPALWLLDSSGITDILENAEFSPYFFKLCIDRLTEMKMPLTFEVLKSLISEREAIDSSLANSLAANFKITPPPVSRDLDDVLQILLVNGHIKVMCSIIRSTNHFPDFIKKLPDISGNSLIEIALTISEVDSVDKSMYRDLLNDASIFALTCIKEDDSNNIISSLSLLSHTLDILSVEQLDEIRFFFNRVSGSITLSSATVSAAESFYRHDPDGLKSWLQKCIVWLTKRFSEDYIISSALKAFLVSFGK